MPVTSFGGLFWGFKMTKTEGEKKNHGGKRTENWRKENGQNMKNSGGDIYYKTGEILRFWNQTCPPGEVWAIYIYIERER